MKILIYSHDSYGLGHIRRSLSIATQLAEDFPLAEQLLLTGSSQSHSYEIPYQLDYIKLPSISKSGGGEYCAGALEVPFDTVSEIRENIIFETVRHYNPDIFLVDKAAAGIRGEILRSLHYLKAESPHTQLVLGMRDIEDDPLVTKADWEINGVYHLLEEIYDHILLYGSREIYDPVQEYQLSREIGKKIISCGYIGRTVHALRPKHELRASLKMKTNLLVVVTAGGGGDGFKILETYLNMLSLMNRSGKLNFNSLVVTGPMMSEEDRRQLQSYQSEGLPLTLIDFTPDMLSYLNAADLVISMGGYNSFCEILTLKKRAIIIPRTKPRVEQLIRAKRFSDLGLVRMLHPEDLNPSRLADEVNTALTTWRPVPPNKAGIHLKGALKASHALGRLVGTAPKSLQLKNR